MTGRVLVVAMAGRSSRFAAEGIVAPKWTLPLRGRTLLEWSLHSVPSLLLDARVILACRSEHRRLVDELVPKLPVAVEVRTLDGERTGQAGDACRALAGVEPELPLVVWNVDTLLDSSLSLPQAGSWMLLAAKRGMEWSFARVEEGKVVEAAERRRVGRWASAGLYGFESVQQFRCLVQDALVPGEECHVAPMYGTLARLGRPADAVCVPSALVLPAGTPAQVRALCRARGWALPPGLG